MTLNLTDEDRLLLSEASSSLHVIRRERQRLEKVEAVYEGLPLAGRRLTEIDRLTADAEARRATVDAEVTKILDAARAEAQQMLDAAQEKLAGVHGQIAAAQDMLAGLEGKLAEAQATIKIGEEWRAKMDEAERIRQRR